MTTITHEVERLSNGTKVVRNYFVFEMPIAILKNLQSEFSKDQKKQAKINYKNSLKNRPQHKAERNVLIECLVGQSIPNWNLKFNVLKN